MRIGPSFGSELRAAGLGNGLAWNSTTGDISGRDSLSPADQVKLDAVIAAHNPAVSVTPTPQSVSRRQMLIGLMNAGYITSAEAIAAAQSGAVPAAIQAVFGGLPTQADRDAAAITWASMSECLRSSVLVAALAASRNLTSAQIDDLFRSWAQL